MRLRSPTILAALLVSVASTASSQTFDFETTPVATPVPFSITRDGLTATFTSFGPFQVTTSGYSSLAGNVLANTGTPAASLTITFGSLLNAITLNFGTNSTFLAGLTLQAYNGLTPVGAASAIGAVPAGFTFPEGSLSFSGASFTSVSLLSTAPGFAIDNVVVRQVSVVPEPATVALFGTGLALVGLVARRRRSR